MYKLLLIYVFLCQVSQSSPTRSLPVLQTDTLPAKSATAMHFDSLGLTNIADVDSTIRVDLMYASPHNFTGRVLYDNLKEGYLHPDAAKALAAAQKELRKESRAIASSFTMQQDRCRFSKNVERGEGYSQEHLCF